jgi:hypothetical protein
MHPLSKAIDRVLPRDETVQHVGGWTRDGEPAGYAPRSTKQTVPLTQGTHRLLAPHPTAGQSVQATGAMEAQKASPSVAIRQPQTPVAQGSPGQHTPRTHSSPQRTWPSAQSDRLIFLPRLLFFFFFAPLGDVARTVASPPSVTGSPRKIWRRSTSAESRRVRSSNREWSILGSFPTFTSCCRPVVLCFSLWCASLPSCRNAFRAGFRAQPVVLALHLPVYASHSGMQRPVLL